MAQQMSIKEMIRVIDDVLGGSLEFTVWQPMGERYFQLEVKSLDLGGSEVGQFDIELTQREAENLSDTMTPGIQYPLGEMTFGNVQFIAFKNKDFREYINRELKP